MSGHVEARGKGRWLCVYYAAGKRRSKSFALKRDAEKFLTTTQADQLRGDWIDPAAGKVTVRQYGDLWLKHRHIRPTTRERYTGYLTYVNLIGDTPLSAVTPSQLEAWQSGLLGHLAPSSVGTIRGVLASMLQDAVRDRLIPRSPMQGIRAPKPVRTLVVPMSTEHVLALHGFITPRYRAATMVGAGLGVRRGECFGLTVDRVDFLRRLVTVDRQLVQLRGGGPVFGPPKTDASVRQIPAPQFVIDALAAHMQAYPPGADGLIFTTRTGAPVGRSSFATMWRDAEVRRWAGQRGRALLLGDRIPAQVAADYDEAHPAGCGSRFHDLRHFYASRLIADGENVKVVQARLGHASASETLDTYSHLWPDDEDRTRRIMDAVFKPETLTPLKDQI